MPAICTSRSRSSAVSGEGRIQQNVGKQIEPVVKSLLNTSTFTPKLLLPP
jgi:hypothetical protein